jgi:hypothetical protein
MFRTAATIRSLVVAALAAAAVAPAAAQADVLALPAQQCVKDTTGPQYDVRLCGVTDVDQFRTGLPGSTPGNSYCMPSSYFNVLRYFAKQVGVPMTFGIAGIDPADPADYTKTTQALGWISIMSGGDPASGSGSYSGELTAWDTFTSYAASKGWAFDRGTHSATADEDFGYELAKRLRHGPVQIGYKRWTQGTPSGGGVWNYSGSGHATTVVGAQGTVGAGEVKLLLADPGRAPDHNTGDWLNTQSAYTLEEVTIKRVEITSNATTPSSGGTTGHVAPATYKKSFQWELTGPNYATWQLGGASRAIIHSYNWFAAAKPVG